MAHFKDGVIMDDDVRPLYEMIDSRRQALGLSWPDVVQRCGYTNVPKGMRRLDAIWDGELRGKASANILTHLANALELDDDAVQAAITLAQDQLDSTREKAERAVFEPSAYLQGTETIPSQITIFGMTGGAERWLRIPLDLTQPPDTFVRQGAGMKRNYRSLLAVFMIAILSALAWPVAAQDGGEAPPHWYVDVYDDIAYLFFGVPESDYVMIHFSCDLGTPIISAYIQDGESTAQVDDMMHVRLLAEGVELKATGRALINEDSGGKDALISLPLNDAFRRLLNTGGTMQVIVDGHVQDYDMSTASVPVERLLEACDTLAPEDDLMVVVVNRADRPLVGLSLSEEGVSMFEGDAFGYDPLAPGDSRSFVIPNGRNICTYDLLVALEEEECCSEGDFVGGVNFCQNREFQVQ